MVAGLSQEMGQVVAYKMMPCLQDYVKYQSGQLGSKPAAEKKMARILKKVFGGMKEYLKNVKWKADNEKRLFQDKSIDIEAPSRIAKASLDGFLDLMKREFFQIYPTLYRVLRKEAEGYI